MKPRILVGVMNFVYALDAATGKPIPSFGKDGRIDLREDLGRDPAAQSIYLTTPAVIYKDLMIVGGRESETLPASPGDVRAYDVRTGKLRWSFHTIPHPGEFGYDTWPKDAWKTSGAANNWAGMTVDAARGIVYVPTGSAAFDFYGADRVGDDLFANCLIALNAETGERIWHFQGVHHDLWDRDFPSPPVLVTVKHDGKKVEAVAQTSKQGFVYLFDRDERQAAVSARLPELSAQRCSGRSGRAATMPALEARALRAPNAHRQIFSANALPRCISGRWISSEVSQRRTVRPVQRRTKIPSSFPDSTAGRSGAAPAVDPDTGILYVNANDLAMDRRSRGEHSSENRRTLPRRST